MSIFDFIPENEKVMMKDYINLYAGGYGINAPLEYIFRHWAREKENLYHYFGDNFIVKKKIEVKKDNYHIQKEIDKMLYENNDDFCKRFHSARRIIENHYLNDENYWNFCNLIGVETLAKNSWDRSPTTIEINGKEVKINRGAKPMRILQKIFAANGCEEIFEEFRIKHSMIFNEKTFLGTMCLSIHPLDYMTMSDNECNWESCMNWRNEGSYRRGTVEMMNSPFAIVAYLESDNSSLLFNGHAWNSKKWRELILCDTNGIICGIKGYPMWNKNLEKIAVEWVKEIMESNGFHYGPIDTIYPWTDDYTYEGEEVYFAPDTEAMYNDFNDEVGHIGCFSDDYFKTRYGKNYELFYSGIGSCMNCGGDVDFSCDNESFLTCDNCDNRCTCHDCGERVYSDDIIWVDDIALCSYCYSEHTFQDIITDEIHHNDNAISIYLMDKEKQIILSSFPAETGWMTIDNLPYDNSIATMFYSTFGEKAKLYRVKVAPKSETGYYCWEKHYWCVDIKDIDPENLEWVKESIFNCYDTDFETYGYHYEDFTIEKTIL